MKPFRLFIFFLVLQSHSLLAQNPVLVADIAPTSPSSYPSEFVLLDNKLFFAASVWNGGIEDRELYSSDGTTAGTQLFLDLWPNGSSSPDKLIVYDYHMYFIVADSSAGNIVYRPWVSDGTTWGTFPLLQNPVTPDGYTMQIDPFVSPDKIFTYYKGFVYFCAKKDNASNDMAIFKSDGTLAGTLIAADLPNSSGVPNDICGVAEFNDTLYFSSRSNGSSVASFYKFTGTNPSITLVKGGVNILPEYGFIEYSGNLIFCGDGNNGPEVWITDGTPAGTYELSDLRTDAGQGSFPGSFSRVDNLVVFVANTNGTSIDLYSIDSTSTSLLPSLVTSVSYQPSPYRSGFFSRFNGKLYFNGHDFINGNELWSTNGRTNGTNLVADIYPGQDDAFPGEFIRYCGSVYFSATNPLNNNQNALYVSDGTFSGTLIVPGTVANPNGSRQVGDKIVYKGELFFAGKYDANTGIELYKYDAGCFTGMPASTNEKPLFVGYPNPTSDWITLRSAEDVIQRISVKDVQGKLLFSSENVNSYEFRLNVSTLVTGCYILQVEGESGVVAIKLMKDD